jgi:hypothetical protein
MLAVSALLLVVASSFPPNAGEVHEDPYSALFIRHCLKAFRAGFKDPAITKHLPQLGDRAAIGLIKGLSKAEIDDPENLAGILGIIREAFSRPDLIGRRQDREPSATMYFLDHLGPVADAPVLKRQVADLRQFILEQLRAKSGP